MDTLDDLKLYVATRYDELADLFARAGARKGFGPDTTSRCIAICQAKSLGLRSSDAPISSMSHETDPGAGTYASMGAWPATSSGAEEEEDSPEATAPPLATAHSPVSTLDGSISNGNSNVPCKLSGRFDAAHANLLISSLGPVPSSWDNETARYNVSQLPGSSIELTKSGNPALEMKYTSQYFLPLPDNGHGVFELYPAVTADLPTVISEYKRYWATGTAPGITCNPDHMRIAFGMIGAEPSLVFGRLCGTPYVLKGILERAHSTFWPSSARESMKGHPKLLPLSTKLKLFANACSISMTEATIKSLEIMPGCFNLWCCPNLGRDCCQAHLDLSMSMVYPDTAYPSDHGTGWQSAVISQIFSTYVLRGLATSQCSDSLLGNLISAAAVSHDPFCSYRQEATSATFKSLTSRHASVPVGSMSGLTSSEWTGYHIARYIDSGLTSLTAHGGRLAYEQLPGSYTEANCRAARIATLIHDLWDVPFDSVGTGSPNSVIAYVKSGALPSYLAVYRRMMGDVLFCAELCLNTGHYRPLLLAIGSILFCEGTARYANLLQDSSDWRPIPRPRVVVVSPRDAYWDLGDGEGRALDMTSTVEKLLERFGMTSSMDEGEDYLATTPHERSAVAMRALYASWRSSLAARTNEDMLEPMRHLLTYFIHWRDLPLGMYAQYLDSLDSLEGKEEDVVANIPI
ncbi:hypothetical protein TWF481_003605 [Arthrobotrys musiformis]|uniref:Uncharacterized protein n=1 Tax=Arthrobotrys musiformis TaxID=47236 RepID=A0AAV9WIM6_9PEZI